MFKFPLRKIKEKKERKYVKAYYIDYHTHHDFISQGTFEDFFSSTRTHRLFSRFGRERRDPGHSQLHVCSFVRDHQRLQTILSTEQMPERCKVRRIVEQL